MLEFNTVNTVDLYSSNKNNISTPVSNTASASFSDTLQSAGTQSLDAIFQKAAQQYDVPVSLLKAIGKAESDFNPNAVSGAGAQGVMQLMPATAKSLGVTNSFDAEQNIMGGAKYIKQMLDRYDGDVKLALAAYNAGSGNVQKYGGIPPFKETQNYVKKVMSYAGETLTAGNYTATQNQTANTTSAVNAATKDTSLQSQIEQSILNFKELTQEDYLLFIESLKNDMTSSLLSSISDMDYDYNDKKDNLFNQNTYLQSYNSLLNHTTLDTTQLNNIPWNNTALNNNTPYYYAISGITSENANFLGSRYQTMYDTYDEDDE